MFTIRFDMRAPSFGAPTSDLYAGAIDMCAWAESRGAIVAVLSEHHGAEDNHLPSPLVLASAIAARTERLPIMLAAVVLPFWDPVRLAEDMSVLDIISKGRVSYAFGIGHRSEEYEHFGIDMRRRGRLADEKLTLLRQLLKGEAVASDGRRTHVTPACTSQGGPFMMLAGGSRAAVKRAARHGLGLVLQTNQGGLKELYENECRANGHEPGFVQLPADGAPTAAFVADEVDRAWDELGPYLLHDAQMAASYRHGDEGVASISRAADVSGLRTANGPYRVFTTDEAVDYMRGGQALPLAPLCGGVPPDLAWPYLERAAEAAAHAERRRTMEESPSRVVVWSTGGVGSIAVDAVHGRPDLELVGVWVHSQDKVGRDAGELAGGEPIGVVATNDAAALIDLRPDCVVYAASGPERDAGAVPDYLRLLEAGINVVSTTSTSLIYPPTYYSPDWRDQLEAAAKSGNASFYGSGIFPGFGSDQLALLLATQSKKIRCIKATEIALNDHYPVADIMMNGLGFGHPLDFEPMLKTPGFIEMAWAAPIHLMADGLGVKVEEVRGSMDRRLTDRDIEVAFGTIKAGTCGAVLTRAAGVVNGREAIVIEHIIRMARDVAPDWQASEFDATYRVDIEGEPDIHCAMNLGDAEGHGAGRAAMAATAMRVVNAIPYVVEAPAGLLSSLDMPNTLPRHVFD